MIHRRLGPSQNAEDFRISRVEVSEGEYDFDPPIVRDFVHVWNHGIAAGILEVRAGEGEFVARWLMPDAEIVERRRR